MSVYEMAKKYYPHAWKEVRIRTLAETGKLTAEEYEDIVGKPYEAQTDE